jgi:acyl-CoA thioester hydrolase
MAASVEPFVHRLRVRWGECDPHGIVFNANYLAYFDVCLTEMWREAVGSRQALVARGVDIVIGEANIRFRAPARNNDLLDVRMHVARLGTMSVTTEVEIVRDAELLVEGSLRHEVVDAKTLENRSIPNWLREALSGFATADL